MGTFHLLAGTPPGDPEYLRFMLFELTLVGLFGAVVAAVVLLSKLLDQSDGDAGSDDSELQGGKSACAPGSEATSAGSAPTPDVRADTSSMPSKPSRIIGLNEPTCGTRTEPVAVKEHSGDRSRSAMPPDGNLATVPNDPASRSVDASDNVDEAS